MKQNIHPTAIIDNAANLTAYPAALMALLARCHNL